MKKIFLLLYGFLFSIELFAQVPASMTTFEQAANRCQDIQCVRENINTIDAQIVILLGERLAFIKRGAQFKALSDSPLHDEDSEAAILLKIGALAEAVGYSPIIARAVYSVILTESNLFEATWVRDFS